MNNLKITFDVKDEELIEKDGKMEIKTTPKKIEFLIDTSLNAQTRFEVNFPAISSKGEDILAYTSRIKDLFEEKLKNNSLSLAELGIILKINYCWFDTNYSFSEFVKLFSSGDSEQNKKNTDKFIFAMKYVLGSSAEKN